MVKLELKLSEKCPKKLGTAPTAKKLFDMINKESDVILDFENIEFMSRSFAQEYVFQKHYSKSEISEINMDNSIKQLLEVVRDDFEQSCLR